jgi:vitamin B12 transporter
LDLLAPGEKRNDDYYDNVTGSTKLGYDVTENFDLGLVARSTDSHLRFTGENFSTFPGTPDAQQSQSDALQYFTRATGHLVLFDGILDQTIGLAYSSDKSSNFSPDGSPSYNSGDRTKLDWQGNVKLSADEVLVLGLEREQDEIETPIAASTTTNSGYAELRSSFVDSFFNTISVRDDDNDRFGSKATFRLAPTYLIKETGTKLKASVGSGFKAPSLSQLFQNFPVFNFFANPNLKPESSLGYDVGAEQTLLDDKVQAGVTYFHNDIKNLITDNASFTSYANVGRATTDGVESYVSYRPTDSWTLRADYTFTEANDDILHLELLRRPKDKASLNAAWQITSNLSFNATVLYVGSWIDGNRDFSIPRLTAPGYVTADLAASYNLTDQLMLFGRITNLLDKHYEDPVGYLQPSRGIYVGIKARL